MLFEIQEKIRADRHQSFSSKSSQYSQSWKEKKRALICKALCSNPQKQISFNIQKVSWLLPFCCQIIFCSHSVLRCFSYTMVCQLCSRLECIYFMKSIVFRNQMFFRMRLADPDCLRNMVIFWVLTMMMHSNPGDDPTEQCQHAGSINHSSHNHSSFIGWMS